MVWCPVQIPPGLWPLQGWGTLGSKAGARVNPSSSYCLPRHKMGKVSLERRVRSATAWTILMSPSPTSPAWPLLPLLSASCCSPTPSSFPHPCCPSVEAPSSSASSGGPGAHSVWSGLDVLHPSAAAADRLWKVVGEGEFSGVEKRDKGGVGGMMVLSITTWGDWEGAILAQGFLCPPLYVATCTPGPG